MFSSNQNCYASTSLCHSVIRSPQRMDRETYQRDEDILVYNPLLITYQNSQIISSVTCLIEKKILENVF